MESKFTSVKLKGISEKVIPCKRPYRFHDLFCNECKNFRVYDGRHRRYEVCLIDYEHFNLRWRFLPTFTCPFRKLEPKQLTLF